MNPIRTPKLIKNITNCKNKELVPKAGLEPAQVSPPPPQDGVSTKFHHFGTENVLVTIISLFYALKTLYSGRLSGMGSPCSATGGAGNPSTFWGASAGGNPSTFWGSCSACSTVFSSIIVGIGSRPVR